MSAEEQLLRRLDDQLGILEWHVLIARELMAGLRGGFAPASSLVPRGTPVSSTDKVRQVRDVLPGELLDKLTVVDQGDGSVTIKSTWLSKPSWDQVNNKVLQMGGEWVSAGKDSHWRVPFP